MRGLVDSPTILDSDPAAPSGFSLEGLSASAVFGLADRRCRTEVDPSARDLLLRSSAYRSLGQNAAALADLREAYRRDAGDAIVARSVLAWADDIALKSEAARALIANPRGGDADLDAALRHLAAIDTSVVLRAQRLGRVVFGWVVSTSDTAPTLLAKHESGSFAVALRSVPSHPFRSFPGRLWTFHIACDAGTAIEIGASGPQGAHAVVSLFATAPPALPMRVQPEPEAPPAVLNVIVPLYRDHESAKACLEALALQESATPLRFLIVDDHSPEPDISALASRFCRLHDATLIVHQVNHGFAGAVNAALARCPDGDVLLLNSDVTLPPLAIDRLIRAAYAGERIGTVMPLSNDSELTSFPLPFKPNPLPSAELAMRIDDAARRVNGDTVVDLINTIGYCVYVRRECLEATGPLSQDYGRGYYEDVDLALRARDKGFRNVAAAGIYVSHGSGRSFGEEKKLLVSRNLPVLCDRFPSFRAENEAYIRLDPLRAVRGAIEAELPPGEPVHLLVGAAAASGSPLSFRARRIVQEGGYVLMVSWRHSEPTARIEIAAPAGFGPHSLAFGLDATGLDALTRYVLGLRLVQIELCDLHTIPSPLYRLLLRTSAPILFFVASLEDAMLVDTGVSPMGQERLTSRDITVDFLAFDRAADPFAYRIPQFLMRSAPAAGASKFVTSDSMAEAVCAEMVHKGRPAAEPRHRGAVHLPERWSAKRLVAVPAPMAAIAVDRLLLDLARHLRSRADTRLLILGRCIDDRALVAIGNVHVTGAAPLEDYPLMVASYGADAVFLPYRTSLFGVLEALSERTPLPRGYFDWSGGLMPYRADDFVLDCRIAADLLCPAFAQWCGPSDTVPEGHA